MRFLKAMLFAESPGLTGMSHYCLYTQNDAKNQSDRFLSQALG